jgi:hypothetical protein
MRAQAFRPELHLLERPPASLLQQHQRLQQRQQQLQLQLQLQQQQAQAPPPSQPALIMPQGAARRQISSLAQQLQRLQELPSLPPPLSTLSVASGLATGVPAASQLAWHAAGVEPPGLLPQPLAMPRPEPSGGLGLLRRPCHQQTPGLTAYTAVLSGFSCNGSAGTSSAIDLAALYLEELCLAEFCCAVADLPSCLRVRLLELSMQGLAAFLFEGC